MKNLLFSLSSSGKSFIEELWDYFVEYYLEAENIYPNLGIDGTSMVTLPVILAGLLIGTLIAVFAVMRDSRVIGAYVRDMLKKGSVGKENAVTLYELHTDERSGFARALRKSVTLRRFVRCVEEEEFYEKKNSGEDVGSDEYRHTGEEHYYIPEDKRIAAEFKYIKRGVSVLAIPVIVLGLVVAFFGLMLVLPYILSLLDAFVGTFNSI